VLSSVPLLSNIIGNLASMIDNIIVFVGAAGLVVAIKAIIAIGKD